MRRNLFAFACLACILSMRAQPIITINGPKYDGASTSASGPNGTTGHDFHRAAFLVLKTELTEFANFTTSVVSTFGFSYLNGADITVAGNFTLYLQNTTNTSYAKGGTFSSIISGMNSYYAGVLTIPAGTSPTTLDFPLDSNFTYTGGGVYVVLEWERTGNAATTPAWYYANSNGLVNGGVRNYGSTAPPTLTTTAFRPVFRFGAVNSATNEIAIERIETKGIFAKLLNQPATVNATVTNKSNISKPLLEVELKVTGANPYTHTIVASLAAGVTTVLSFNNYFPTVDGLSDMTVSVTGDQNNSNNSFTWSQSVTCNMEGNHPGNMSFTSGPGLLTYNNVFGYTSGSGMFLAKHNFPTTASLTGVMIAIGAASQNTSSPREISGVVLNSTGGIVAQTPGFLIQQAGAHATLDFTVAPALTPNQDYYIGVIQPTSGYFPMATRAFTTMPVPNYWRSPATGGTLIAISNFTGYMGIAPIVKVPEMLITTKSSKFHSCKGDAVTLTVTGQPGITYTWQPGSYNTPVITVTLQPVNQSTSSIIFYSVLGTHTASGCQTETSVISLSVSLCPGLGEDLADYASLRLYPNPAVIGIVSLSGLQGENDIEVFNVAGQQVKKYRSSGEQQQLDLSALPPSTYFVKVSNANQQLKVFKVLTQ